MSWTRTGPENLLLPHDSGCIPWDPLKQVIAGHGGGPQLEPLTVAIVLPYLNIRPGVADKEGDRRTVDPLDRIQAPGGAT